MRIDNDIWSDTILSERHIFLGPDDRQDTFLSMSWTEFVSDDGIPGVADRVAHAHMIRVFFVTHQSYGLDSSSLGILKGCVLDFIKHSIVDCLFSVALF